MTIRGKILLIFSFTLASLMIASYWISTRIFLDGFSALERSEVRDNVKRVVSSIDECRSTLESRSWDWAHWDEAYEFMKDGRESFATANHSANTLQQLRLNLIVYVHPSGKIALGKALDLESGQETPLPAHFREQLDPSDMLLGHPTPDSLVSGVMSFPEGRMMIVSRPILTSDGNGPAMGTLVMGRYLDSEELNRVAQRTKLHVTAICCEGAAAVSGLSVPFGPEEPDGIAVRPLSDEEVAGYAVIRNLEGNPTLLLRVNMWRSTLKEGQRTIRYFLGAFLAAGLIFGLLNVFFLEKHLISKLRRFGAEVSAIRATRDLTARISTNGADELGQLARNVNSMLETLEDSQQKLRLLSSRVLTAQEDERKHIAHELHDSVGQSLSAIKFGIENAIETIRNEDDEDGAGRARSLDSLQALVPITQLAIEEIRKIYMDLRPSMLDDLGVVATMRWFCRQFQQIYSSIRVELRVEIAEEEIPERLKIVIFRIVQEAFHNIAKYSGATRAIVSLFKRDDAVELAISDNGVGFEQHRVAYNDDRRPGLGLTGMKERSELSGGRLTVESAVGSGTSIAASWPLRSGAS